MEAMTTTEIAPLTNTDIEAAADGHFTTAGEVREAASEAAAIISEYSSEWADMVPEGHGQYTEPTVIWQSDGYVCIYVDYGAWDATTDALEERNDYDGDDTARAVVWAHNNFARRKGASPDALGTMDAVILPRTETVEEIIDDRR